MKNKIIALTLTAVLALSSTSVLAADCTNLATVSQYNVTVNGKTIDLSSLDWKKILNRNTTVTNKITQTTETAPAVTEAAETAPAVTEPVETAPTTSSTLTYEQQVVELVNIERQKNGLSALTLSSSISDVARAKSQDMATNNYFAHQSPTYGSAGDMLTDFGITWSAWGENIASGQMTPEAVVTAWMNSTGHRANILSSSFTKIGVGYATNSNGTPYWTQMFTN
jgi:uncharacterized YkwD family protein